MSTQTGQVEISNQASGIDYSVLNKFKAMMMAVSAASASFPSHWGLDFEVIKETIGKTAIVFRFGPYQFVLVLEGLGTKIEIALAMQELTGQLFYHLIAQDTIAMSANDVAVSGAKPLVLVDYAGVGDSKWLDDLDRARNFASGVLEGCRMAHVALVGGETPALPPIIFPNTIDLAGAIVGVLDPERRPSGVICPGDDIIFAPSNGICSNGVSPVREMNDKGLLPNGYLTPIGDGRTFGEALLAPTPIVVDDVQRVLDVARPHSIEPITGGAFLKIARSQQRLTYVVDCIPALSPLYRFIRDRSGVSDETAYKTWNMGVLTAYLAPPQDTPAILGAIKDSFVGGHVEEGPRQVVVGPLNDLVLREDGWE